MENILIIDTSTDACSVAIGQKEQVLSRFTIAPQQHGRLILPMINELLEEANLSLQDLAAIAFACGPGSFTGVRIATGIVQGLAYGANLPVIAISTLQAMAQGAYQAYGAKIVVPVLDARIDEVYWGHYHLDADDTMQPAQGDALAKPQEVICPNNQGWCAVGTGWSAYEQLLPSVPPADRHSQFFPHAKPMIPLAYRALKRGEMQLPSQVQPVYLRNKVTDHSR